jgi:hypothetical protein
LNLTVACVSMTAIIGGATSNDKRDCTDICCLVFLFDLGEEISDAMDVMVMS